MRIAICIVKSKLETTTETQTFLKNCIHRYTIDVQSKAFAKLIKVRAIYQTYYTSVHRC